MREIKFGLVGGGLEKELRAIIDCCGEMTQLESTMYLLDGLLGWCEVCFNNEQEEKDYELLSQAYKILEQVHKNYKELY
jgi:hypothetical protein